MRRSFKELKFLFDALDESYSLNSDSCQEFAFVFLMHLKLTAILCNKIYPSMELGFPDITMNGYKDIYYGGIRPDDDLEYIVESKLGCSCIPDYVLAYFMRSPHWDVRVRSLYLDTSDDYVCNDGDSFYVGEEFVRHSYGDFLDKEIYEDKNNMEKIERCYEVGDDFTDDLCVIRSDLYPYIPLFKKAAGRRHREKFLYLDKAFRVIRRWLNGFSFEITTSKHGYFFCSDDSDENYGAVMGCIIHERAMVVAAELIEEIIFSLDAEYHLLPEEIKRKEEERWKS